MHFEDDEAELEAVMQWWIEAVMQWWWQFNGGKCIKILRKAASTTPLMTRLSLF
jgi:hypothetical protein